MNTKLIEFHNVAAFESLNGMPGQCLVRYPKKVRAQINQGAHYLGTYATGVELRFVCNGGRIRLTLAAHDNDIYVRVMRGNFGHSEQMIPAGSTRVICLEQPTHFASVARESLASGSFSPDVWRVQLCNGAMSFLGIESFGAKLRPPLPEEKPKLRWLAYGSSITHSNSRGYPDQTARLLGVDVLNKGLSGSCHCEKEIAAHFALEEKWDFATLELGVNMRGCFTPCEFEERVRTFVNILREKRPDAPLVLITHFLNREHHPSPELRDTVARENQLAFDKILRSIAEEKRNDSVHLLEGTDILTCMTGLHTDLLHPSDYGHVLMGANLAHKLKSILPYWDNDVTG